MDQNCIDITGGNQTTNVSPWFKIWNTDYSINQIYIEIAGAANSTYKYVTTNEIFETLMIQSFKIMVTVNFHNILIIGNSFNVRILVCYQYVIPVMFINLYNMLHLLDF